MKTLQQIREASGGKEAYQKFFNSILTKFGVKSPAELDDDKKKDFYDAIDKGWDGDNEKPEKNEKMNQDNMDPETMNDADPDEKEINAGYIKSAYHMKKESVNEKTKLKGGRGKAEVDINWVGDKKDIKFATTKYKIKIKPHSDGAIVTGDKQKILAYLTGQDYAMDDEDIEDLYPELMEGYNSPKPLSAIINRYTVSAVTEKTSKADDDDEDLDPETTKVEAKAPKLSTSDMMKISKIADKNSGDMEKAIKLIDKVKKGASEHPDVMAMLKLANESVQEANRFSVKLKGAAKDLFALSWKAGGKSKAYGDKEWDAAVDKMAAKYRDDNHTRISDKDIAAVKQAIKHESVSEGVDVDRRTKGFKDAMIRNEKSKKVKEKSKAKKTMAKNQAELDANYAYDGEIDELMAAASRVMMGQPKLETAANSAASGNVDMNPTGKPKKDKEKLMARKY